MVQKACWDFCFQGGRDLGKKQGSCSNKDFLRPRALAAHSACPCESWMVLGFVLDKTGFVSVSALCVCRSHSLVSFLSAHQEHSSHTSTREGHAKGTEMELDKYLGLMQLSPSLGFAWPSSGKLHRAGALRKGTEGPSLSYFSFQLHKWWRSAFCTPQWVPRAR